MKELQEQVAQLGSVALDLAHGVDPTTRARLKENIDLAIKEAERAGVTIPEGSVVKGQLGKTGISELMQSIGAYESDISVSTMKRMLKDPDVAFSIAALTGPIAGCEWSTECTDADIAKVVKEVFDAIWTPLMASTGDAIAIGMQAYEKIYTIRDITVPGEGGKTHANQVAYQEVFDVDPEKVKLKKANGELVGYYVGDVFVPIDLTGRTIDKGAILTMPRVQWGNYRGSGRLVQAYQPWWNKSVVTQLMLRYLERLGDPPLIGRCPKGKSKNMSGVVVDNLDLMMNLLTYIRSHGSVVLPYEVDPNTKEMMWSISLLEDDSRVGPWLEVIQHFSILVMRAALQPEKRITEGKAVGSHAMVQVQNDVAEMIAENLQKAVFTQFTQQLVPPIVIANFGLNAPPCRLVPGPMSHANIDVLETVLNAIVDYEKGSMPESPITEMVDRLELLKDLRVPTKAEEDEPEEITVQTKKEEPEEQQEQKEQNLAHIKLAATKAQVRAKYRRQINLRAKEWKANVADKVLKDQIDYAAKQVERALRMSSYDAKLRALNNIRIPSTKYRAELEAFMSEMHELGRRSAAEELSVTFIKEAPRSEVQTMKAISKGLADDRAANIARITHVAALNTLKNGYEPERALFEIKKRSEKRLQNLSNQTTATAEAWRGFHSGKQYAALNGAPADDPIIAAQFHAATGACPFCRSLDGQYIEVDHPDFFAMLPPQHHNCQCDVEYIRASAAPTGGIPRFEKPPQSLIDTADEYFIPKEVL